MNIFLGDSYLVAIAFDFGLSRIFSCDGPRGRLGIEEVSAKSGQAGAALAITHLMLGRKFYLQSQQAKQAAVWQEGGSLHSQLFGSE